jgi:hypothetical protein
VAGRPLPAALREGLARSFGDETAGVAVRPELDRVRLHGGFFARWLCRRFGAGAVTFGRRVLCSADAWRRLRADAEASTEAGTEVDVGPASASGPEVGALALAAHEVAHVLQYRRDGILRLLARYVWEYLRGRLRGLSHDAAYRAISYEREAFAAEAEALRRHECPLDFFEIL